MQSFSQVPKAPLTVGTSFHKLTGVTADCISSVRFSPRECPVTLVGVTSWDATCSVWQVAAGANGTIESKPMWSTTHDGPLLDMSFSSDGRAYFAGCTKSAVMWDLNSGQKAVVATHDLPISSLAHITIPQAMSEILVTSSWDGKLRWWDARQMRCTNEQNLNEPIFAIDAQKTYPMLAAATGRTVHVYNLQSMQKFKQLEPPDIVKFNIRCLSCSPTFDGVCIGTSEGRSSFIPFEAGSGCTFKNHIADYRSQYIMRQTNFCAHHPSLPVYITGGGDGKIVVINRELRKILTSLECTEKFENEPVPIAAGDISADGSLLAYAYSYDWAMGAEYWRNQPNSVYLRTITRS